MAETKRKGSKSAKEIQKEIMEQLNNGKIETANLVEWLAINQRHLLENLLKQNNRIQYFKPIVSAIDDLKKQTVNTINEAIGIGILQQTIEHNDSAFLHIITHHHSDAIRCWATYTIAKNNSLTISQQLQQMQPLAADIHFGVREISWLSLRQSISKNLSESLSILSEWTKHKDENIRRFASEATRPRGVWCEHINALKQNPSLALCILEPLKNDNTKYVQDSVANWLNDASKTQPQFVIDICKKWQQESPTKETAYIIKKALRTIEK